MSRDRVTGERYSQKEVSGISLHGDRVSQPGNTEGEKGAVTERRCTLCGRRGHYRTSSVYHPVVRS